LAVRRVAEGWTRKDVAAFLGVHPETVAEWVRAHKAGGDAALAATRVVPRISSHSNPSRD